MEQLQQQKEQDEAIKTPNPLIIPTHLSHLTKSGNILQENGANPS